MALVNKPEDDKSDDDTKPTKGKATEKETVTEDKAKSETKSKKAKQSKAEEKSTAGSFNDFFDNNPDVVINVTENIVVEKDEVNEPPMVRVDTSTVQPPQIPVEPVVQETPQPQVNTSGFFQQSPQFQSPPVNNPFTNVNTNGFNNAFNGGNVNNFKQGTTNMNFDLNNGINSIRAALGSPLDSNGVDNRSTQILNVALEYYEQSKANNDVLSRIDIILAPAGQLGLPYSGILISIPALDNKGKLIRVASHLILIENDQKLNPQQQTAGGVLYSVESVPAGTLTSETSKNIGIILTKKYNVTNDQKVEFLDAGYSVIPQEMLVNSVESIRRIIREAANNAYDIVFNGQSDASIVIAEAVSKGAVDLTATIDLKPIDECNVTGLPVNTDFKLTTSVSNRNTSGQLNSWANGSQRMPIVTTNVFCTMYYQPTTSGIPSFGGMVNQPTQKYLNQVVISNIDTDGVVRLTLGTALLGLASSCVLAHGNLWYLAYSPNKNIPSKQMDIRDIGALGWENKEINQDGNPGKLDTKNANFTEQKLAALLGALFHQNLSYAIDIDDGNNVLGVFTRAARGDIEANQQIINTVNTMTNGAFVKHYKGTPMFSGVTRVPKGYYRDGNNKIHALDRIDYLALLNLTSGDTALCDTYQSAVSDGNSFVSMGTRENILKNMTSNTAVIKGYASRLIISPDFMVSLVRALQESNMWTRINPGALGNSLATQRAGLNFSSGQLIDPSVFGANMFSQGNAFNGGNFFQGYQGTHWG